MAKNLTIRFKFKEHSSTADTSR